MKKLPLVCALATASLCSVAGAQSSVQVYGKLYPYIEQESGSGQSAVGTPKATLAATPTGVKGVPSLKGMSAGNSNLGLRGKEDLGGGLQAEFQIEGTVAVDTGNAAGFFWNRNTFVGLQGGFGEVRLGFMDTVFKEYGDTLGILGISSGTPVSSSNILRRVGFGTSSSSRFHERRANSIRYDSPALRGLQGAFQVATQENPTATAGSAKTYSIGVKYDQGPIYLALAYERHDNFFGGSLNSNAAQSNVGTAGVKSQDNALQGTVEWRFTKDQKIEFDIINKSYKENGIALGKFQNYKNTAYLLGYDGRFGVGWRVMAHVVKSGTGSCSVVGAACSTAGLEGRQVTAGLSYNLSRRTYLFGAYTKITNGVSARFAATDLGGVAAPGEDSRHLLAGISHNF